ncbi:MAG: LysR substrate-binding domain-containing protein [Pigmentiphaga sp.]|nr:LysR substrate-binding domain-containing protein [Pigmentiphaga sp.]
MKLTALQALVAAVQEGSLRAAARQLGVSQPALSKMIRELELELAAPLLTRSTRGVTATPQGQVLFEHARKVAQELTAATGKIQQLSGRMHGELNIAAVPVAVLLLIPEAVKTFGRAFPDIRLRLSEELFAEPLQRLRNGSIDIMVGGIPDGLASGEFITEALMQTRMVAVARKGSPSATATRLGALSTAKWVYTSAGHDSGYAHRLFSRHGLPAPPIGAVVDSTLTLLALIAGSDYIGLMPEQILEHPLAAPYLVRLPLQEDGLPLTIGAITQRNAVISPAIRHFIAHLHRAAR